MANKVRAKSARAKVWEAMRALKRDITVQRICTLADAGEENVLKYVRALELAGYLRKDRTDPDGRHSYSLARDTGLLAPVQKLIRTVWDPNTGEYWTEAGWRRDCTESEKMAAGEEVGCSKSEK